MAGGFQPVQAYDVIVANLGPDLTRARPAEEPLDALALYPGGLTTQEVAEVMRTDIEEPLNRRAAAQSLIRAVGRILGRLQEGVGSQAFPLAIELVVERQTGR